MNSFFFNSLLSKSDEIGEAAVNIEKLKVTSIKKNLPIIAVLEPRLLDYRCCPFQKPILPSPWSQ